MCIRDRLSGKYDFESDFGKSPAMLQEKSPLSTLSPGGKERRFRCARFSVKTWIRERHFSAALDKGDHMAAQGKRYPPSVQNPTLENLARCCLRNLPVSYTHLTLPTSDLV